MQVIDHIWPNYSQYRANFYNNFNSGSQTTVLLDRFSTASLADRKRIAL
jgi:hypothetical protein